MNLSRRSLLVGSASMLALVGCAGTPDVIAAQIKQYVGLISAGLATLIAALGAIPGVSVPPDIVAKVHAELGIINDNADKIASAVVVNPDWAQQISAALQVIAALLTPFFPAAPLIATAIAAAIKLIQVVLGLLNQPAPPAALAAPGVRSYTEDGAVARLKDAAANGLVP